MEISQVLRLFVCGVYIGKNFIIIWQITSKWSILLFIHKFYILAVEYDKLHTKSSYREQVTKLKHPNTKRQFFRLHLSNEKYRIINSDLPRTVVRAMMVYSGTIYSSHNQHFPLGICQHNVKQLFSQQITLEPRLNWMAHRCTALAIPSHLSLVRALFLLGIQLPLTTAPSITWAVNRPLLFWPEQQCRRTLIEPSAATQV